MRKLRLATLSLVVVGAATVSYADVNFEQITFQQAIEKAKRTDQFVMIDFYTDWCVPCKELDRHIFKDTTIGRFINQRFIAVKINAEKEDGLVLMQKYQLIKAYPTVLLLNSEGKEIDRIVGLFGKEDYFQTLRDYAEGENTFSALLSQLENDEDNPELWFKVAKKYKDRGNSQKAVEYFEKASSYEPYVNDVILWWSLGGSYYGLSEFEKAAKAIRKAIQLEPDNPYLKKFLDKLETELNK
ncbi:MAG: thioredoxin family protein [bacterium]